MLLDKVDQAILDELEADGRQTIQALARKLDMSRTAVRHRLHRLRDTGVLTITCVVDSDLLGYQFLVVIGINVVPGTTDAVANQLASLTAVRIVSLSTGRYTIVAWALLKDRLALSDFVSGDMAGIIGISATEVMHSFQWVKNAWGYFKPQMNPFSVHQRNQLSDLDLSVINALQQAPRQPITELAKTVGCGRPMAKASLQKLLNDGVIRFVNIIDPKALGYGLSVVILIKAKPDSVHAVTNALSAQDRVMNVSLITGQWQVLVGALLEDREKMNEFLLETLPLIPGIDEFEVIQLVKNVKYSTSLVGLA